MISDLMDDPTWNCDYKSRCYIPLIKKFIKDLEKYKFVTTNDALIKKWEKELKRCEEDDK